MVSFRNSICWLEFYLDAFGVCVCSFLAQGFSLSTNEILHNLVCNMTSFIAIQRKQMKTQIVGEVGHVKWEIYDGRHFFH